MIAYLFVPQRDGDISLSVMMHKDFNDTILGTFCIFVLFMRIIAISTLKNYWNTNENSEQPLKSWIQETQRSSWKNSAELKSKFRNASIINSKRVVFNIKGNDFRLIVDIEYRLKIVFIVWIGTHKQYDKIDVKTVSYDKAD